MRKEKAAVIEHYIQESASMCDNLGIFGFFGY